jgi:hypothetical protein
VNTSITGLQRESMEVKKIKSELEDLRQDLVLAEARAADLKLRLVMALVLVEQIKTEIQNYGGEN